jgi:hypothetical protein
VFAQVAAHGVHLQRHRRRGWSWSAFFGAQIQAGPTDPRTHPGRGDQHIEQLAARWVVPELGTSVHELRVRTARCGRVPSADRRAGNTSMASRAHGIHSLDVRWGDGNGKEATAVVTRYGYRHEMFFEGCELRRGKRRAVSLPTSALRSQRPGRGAVTGNVANPVRLRDATGSQHRSAE